MSKILLFFLIISLNIQAGSIKETPVNEGYNALIALSESNDFCNDFSIGLSLKGSDIQELFLASCLKNLNESKIIENKDNIPFYRVDMKKTDVFCNEVTFDSKALTKSKDNRKEIDMLDTIGFCMMTMNKRIK